MKKKFREVAQWYMNSVKFKKNVACTQKRDEAMINVMVRYFQLKTHPDILTMDVLCENKLTPEKVAEFMTMLERNNKAPATIIKYINIASHMIERARVMEYWDIPNPFTGMARDIETPEPRERIFTDDEKRRLWIALKEPYRSMVKFMLEVGIRPGMCRELTWDRVDFATGFVKFNWQDHKSGRRKRSGKLKKSSLNSEAMKILRERKKQLIGPYVFHVLGEMIQPHTLRNRFNAAQERAGIKEDWSYGEAGRRLRTYDARRTMITESWENGIPLEAISSQVGHENIRTTQRYVQEDEWKLIKKYF